jgi:3-hydroxy-9,10-secoandrosta-1,3,5(10)-triene-9,17-dione monooxygenase
MQQKVTEPASGNQTREQLLARAEALVPVLAERSAECEKLRRCPDATIADFIDNGLLKICQPKRYGGYDLGYDVMCEVIQTLAHGCGSQAWVHMVLADNPLKLAAFSLEAQDEVWGKDTNQKICVAIAAVGKAKEVPGGVVWNGVHGFSSGIDHADWVICGGNIIRDGRPPQGCFVVVPTKQVRIIDDWHVIGLAGTGSKSFAVEDVFVPWHRVLDKKANDEGTAPGTVFYTAPISKLPRGGVSAVSYTAAAVGVAEGFLANYIQSTATRKSRGNEVAVDPGIQMSLGLSSAEIEAACRMYLGAVRECMQTLERGELVSKTQNLIGKRNACYAAQLAMQAVQRLFNNAGGRALYLDNVLQRQWRDCYAASAHHSLAWESAATGYGRHVLGVGGKYH